MGKELLFATISPRPRFKLISWPAEEVQLDQEVFTLLKGSDSAEMNGFYDFLRTSSGNIVGVRYIPLGEFVKIFDSASPGPGVRIARSEPLANVDLFLGDVQDYDASLSGDQMFGDNFLFVSPSKAYAVTFSLEHLDKKEANYLRDRLHELDRPSSPRSRSL